MKLLPKNVPNQIHTPNILLFYFHSSLAIASIFAQVSNLLAFLVVFWFDFEHLHLATEAEHRKEFSIDGFPFFFCMAIFCYEVRYHEISEILHYVCR